ncbi:Gfo/Idh/MocA family oxidoreductase [Micromonospora zhanjiangensis]
MSRSTIGILVNGVTGRMGYRQHLVRSLLAIREQGGLLLRDGTRLWPEPFLVGRSETKLREIADRHGLTNWSTDLASALARPDVQIYFDAQVTSEREKALRAAIDAGKHIYTEKPLAGDLAAAVDLARRADAAGIKHGVVQDKLFLPGLRKLDRLVRSGFFGRILSIRGEFGYWVFEGDWQPAQRPSWNYRSADGGGITTDMFPHWHYVLEQIFGRVRTVTAHVTTHIDRRWDETGAEYQATADDAAYGIFELDDGIVAQINSSWAVRVHRDELVEFQVDGTQGSAVAGLRECRIQHRAATPARCGTRTCRAPTTSGPAGRPCPTTRSSTTASRPSGNCSCDTWPRARRTAGTCGPALAACNSPRRACARPARVAGSPWRS